MKTGYPLRLYSICLLFCGLLFCGSLSFAKTQTGLPSGLCSNSYYQCDAQTKQRWSLFQSGDGINIKQDDYLSVGACSRNGESNSEVFVLLALSQHVNQLYFDAKISFHNDLSRYHNTPASQLYEIFPKIQYPHNRMSNYDSHAYIDYSIHAPFRYWIRHNPSEDKILMVAYFGYLDTFLCEFQPI